MQLGNLLRSSLEMGREKAGIALLQRESRLDGICDVLQRKFHRLVGAQRE